MAYDHVLEHPATQGYDLALFKAAWCDWKIGERNSGLAVPRTHLTRKSKARRQRIWAKGGWRTPLSSRAMSTLKNSRSNSRWRRKFRDCVAVFWGGDRVRRALGWSPIRASRCALIFGPAGPETVAVARAVVMNGDEAVSLSSETGKAGGEVTTKVISPSFFVRPVHVVSSWLTLQI